jgi:uncharacterized protein YwgA
MGSAMGTLTAKDWTLLAIASARGRPLTPVQLQKSLFLLGKALPSAVGPDFYVFEAYNYGPFNRQVYADAEELEGAGFVALVPHAGGDWQDYAVTQAGTRRASQLNAKAPANAGDYLVKLVQWASGQTFPELVRWVYANYPEYKKNSVFSD